MLSIGSIVCLKGGNRKMMVLNRGPILEFETGKKYFDYSGCLYPNGLSIDNTFYFNHENVDKVIFNGFSDEEEVSFLEQYKTWENNLDEKIEKGKI